MKLSIIMPVFNLPDLTKRALVSVPYDEDLEVIVTDDCSTEDMSFLEEYAAEGKIRLFHNETSKGTGFTRSFMIDQCEGDYIFGMDNDDYLITNEFRKAMKELDGTDMVFINQRINDGFIFELCEENKHHYCAFWSKFVKRSLVGDTRCIDANVMDDYYFNEAIMAKPHTEKYTGIVAYHYNFPREGSILWKRDHNDS